MVLQEPALRICVKRVHVTVYLDYVYVWWSVSMPVDLH
jgi:hypothetical protein